MVTMRLPAAAETGSAQERTGSPLTCTVQAPHCAMPQPNFGPLTLSSSRSTHSSGISGSTSTCCARPLTISLIISLASFRDRVTLIHGPHLHRSARGVFFHARAFPGFVSQQADPRDRRLLG